MTFHQTFDGDGAMWLPGESIFQAETISRSTSLVCLSNSRVTAVARAKIKEEKQGRGSGW